LITHVSSSENQAHRRNNGESSTSEQSAKNSKAIEDGLFKIMHSAMANYESECDQQHELDKDKLALLECEDELEARRGSK